MEEKPIKCFISYSHNDKTMFSKFITHFKNIERTYNIEEWYDGKIMPGEEIDKSISRNINNADIIFLLISPNYIASYYCFEKELQVAVKRHKKNNCLVIPVILKKFNEGNYPFNGLMYVPTDGRPISSFKPHNDGLVDAFKGICKLLDLFIAKKAETAQNQQSLIEAESIPTCINEEKEIKVPLVKNGKLKDHVLSQRDFNCISSFGFLSSQFQYDANILMENQLNGLSKSFTERSKEKTVLKNGKCDLENLLLQLFLYIQKNLIGEQNTCMHFRFEQNELYRSFYQIGYPTIELSVEPILKSNSLIGCSITKQMPVIKSLNSSIHKKAHPYERTNRDYITFTFNEISKRYDVNMSMCISVIGKHKDKCADTFIPMVVFRFDRIIENYLIQYIDACMRLNRRYNIKKVLNYRS